MPSQVGVTSSADGCSDLAQPQEPSLSRLWPPGLPPETKPHHPEEEPSPARVLVVPGPQGTPLAVPVVLPRPRVRSRQGLCGSPWLQPGAG